MIQNNNAERKYSINFFGNNTGRTSWIDYVSFAENKIAKDISLL